MFVSQFQFAFFKISLQKKTEREGERKRKKDRLNEFNIIEYHEY